MFVKKTDQFLSSNKKDKDAQKRKLVLFLPDGVYIKSVVNLGKVVHTHVPLSPRSSLVPVKGR